MPFFFFFFFFFFDVNTFLFRVRGVGRIKKKKPRNFSAKTVDSEIFSKNFRKKFLGPQFLSKKILKTKILAWWIFPNKILASKVFMTFLWNFGSKKNFGFRNLFDNNLGSKGFFEKNFASKNFYDNNFGIRNFFDKYFGSRNFFLEKHWLKKFRNKKLKMFWLKNVDKKYLFFLA